MVLLLIPVPSFPNGGKIEVLIQDEVVATSPVGEPVDGSYLVMVPKNKLLAYVTMTVLVTYFIYDDFGNPDGPSESASYRIDH